MSTYNILITEPAEEDLYRIGTYISKELLEPEAAKKVISKIADGIILYFILSLRRTKQLLLSEYYIVEEIG